MGDGLLFDMGDTSTSRDRWNNGISYVQKPKPSERED
jgi:hypothetical protein